MANPIIATAPQQDAAMTKPATPDALETLFAEIASTAYLAREMFRHCNNDSEASCAATLEVVMQKIALMGWMADIGLKRFDSINCMHDARAELWLLPPMAVQALGSAEGL